MSKKILFLTISICSLSLLWVTDAVIDCLAFAEGTLYQQLFHPERREFWMRSNLLVFSALFMTCFGLYLRRRHFLQVNLEEALAEAERTEVEVRTLNDILTRQTEALETVNGDLRSFSYTVSHDVRRPLTIIYSAAQSLQAQIPEIDGEAAFLARTICDASVRMEQLIDALQLLSHVSIGDMHHNEVNLSAVAGEVVAELQRLEPDRAVDFRVMPNLHATGDERMLRLLLENLIGNAWKYSKHSVPAVIEFGETETELGRFYFVRDNGVGYDMSEAGGLFHPFTRLRNAADFPGTGIGLSTVARIVKRHGGKVWSEGKKGSGATFYFNLATSAAAGN